LQDRVPEKTKGARMDAFFFMPIGLLPQAA